MNAVMTAVTARGVAAVMIVLAPLVAMAMINPLGDVGRVSSPYGTRTHPVTGERNKPHNGIDIAAPRGTPIGSPAGGTVIFAGSAGSAGNMVKVRHQDHQGRTVETVYMHMDRIDVRKGQQVGSRDQLGTVGTTGRSTGNHLHYEVRVDGRKIDPAGAEAAQIEQGLGFSGGAINAPAGGVGNGGTSFSSTSNACGQPVRTCQ